MNLPGYRQEQVRSAYRDGKQLGGYRIYERVLRVGSAQIATGCIGGVYTRSEVHNQGVATALMHDCIVHKRRLMSILCCYSTVFPKFYHRYGFCDVYDLSTQELDHQAILHAGHIWLSPHSRRITST